MEHKYFSKPINYNRYSNLKTLTLLSQLLTYFPYKLQSLVLKNHPFSKIRNDYPQRLYKIAKSKTRPFFTVFLMCGTACIEKVVFEIICYTYQISFCSKCNLYKRSTPSPLAVIRISAKSSK